MKSPENVQLLYKTPQETSSESGYIPALVESLRVETVLNFDIYVQESGDSTYALYRKSNLPFTSENAEHLRHRDEGRFYIKAADRSRYLQYLEQNLTIVLKDERIPLEKKSTMLYHSARKHSQPDFSIIPARPKISGAHRAWCQISADTSSATHARFRAC